MNKRLPGDVYRMHSQWWFRDDLNNPQGPFKFYEDAREEARKARDDLEYISSMVHLVEAWS
jgi:hypothetical protein